MAETRALYEQVILDHAKHPRNFREIEPCDHQSEGYNPLCGDHFTVYLKLDGEVIQDLAFMGTGCAISKSSASVMTTLLKGKTVREARDAFTRFHQMITAPPGTPLDSAGLGKLGVFSGVREYPVRIKCAILPWHTLAAALEDRPEPVSTE